MKYIAYFVAHSFLLVAAYLYFLVTKKNTERGIQALVFLYCHTRGNVNQWLLRVEQLFGARLQQLNDKEGVLGRASDMVNLLPDLQSKGFHVKQNALSPDACDRLMAFALNTPAIVRPMDGQERSSENILKMVDLANPLAVRYDYKTSDLLANPDVQNLLSDPSLLTLAEAYLGKAPKVDVLSMWWHFHFHDQPDSNAAQLYHFDLDRPRWLKVFIYLTDVGPDNGPHSFIQGSHRPGTIPDDILKRGYVRLSDTEVTSIIGEHQEKVFTAPRGSIIVEDTIGLHKGGVVQGSGRLILQLQFSSSLFGAKTPTSAKLPTHQTEDLKRAIEYNPSVFSGYLSR